METTHIQTTSFESLHYIPVTRRDFGTIEIDIRDDTRKKIAISVWTCGGETTF